MKQFIIFRGFEKNLKFTIFGLFFLQLLKLLMKSTILKFQVSKTKFE